MSKFTGSVLWITGLSSSGKTTLAKEVYKILKSKNLPVVLFDGDELREIFKCNNNSVQNYSREERMDFAMRYAKLCLHFSSQDLIVIIATISLFKEVHEWNRSNIPNYFEVYLKVPLSELKRRDFKGIYKRFDKGQLKQVAGLDLKIDEPENADWVVEYDPARSPNSLAHELLQRSNL